MSGKVGRCQQTFERKNKRDFAPTQIKEILQIFTLWLAEEIPFPARMDLAIKKNVDITSLPQVNFPPII